MRWVEQGVLYRLARHKGIGLATRLDVVVALESPLQIVVNQEGDT